MKFQLIVAIFTVAARVAVAGVFQLPKDNPKFSIEFSDKWQTELNGDAVTARGPKESKAIFVVFPVASAKSLQDGLTTATEQFKKDYSDVALDKPVQFKEAGMDILGTEGKAKKDGVEVRTSIFCFSPDGQRYFAATWACDQASSATYGTEIDRVLNSIKPFKEESNKPKEKGGKTTSTVSFPNDKPALTIEVPSSFTTDATAERLTSTPVGNRHC